MPQKPQPNNPYQPNPLDLADAFDRAMVPDLSRQPLTPDNPKLSLISRLAYRFDPAMRSLEKGVRIAELKLKEKMLVAAEQGTVVRDYHDPFEQMDGMNGVRKPTGWGFADLRAWGHHCEPLASVISCLVDQVAAYSKQATRHKGHYAEPGWVICMTEEEEQATDDDIKNFKTYSRFFQDCGFCHPPVDERSGQWQPGFEPFLRAITRDRLTLDWIAVRRWPSAVDPLKYPIVSFSYEDAALIRKRRRITTSIENFVPKTEEGQRTRTNTSKEITLVRVAMDSDDVIEEFTSEELFTSFARVRTDEAANGYGYVEAEQAINAITMWCEARQFNAERFSKNSLPRGILSILGNLSDQQLSAFRKQWGQMTKGAGKAWSIPILSGRAEAGSKVQFDAFDLSPKDMEMSQTLFIVALWIHSLYGVHPEETGYAAASPFKPPLSEASPEATLTHSQERALHPLLRYIESLMNQHLLWVLDPSKRYTFKFVGMGDHNEMDDINAATARLAAGLTSPRMEWAERDVVFPDAVMNHPASDLPMAWAQGVMFLEQLKQAQQQATQAATPGEDPNGPPGQAQGQPPKGALGGPKNQAGGMMDENGDEAAGPQDIGKEREGEVMRQQSIKRFQSDQTGGASPGSGGQAGSGGAPNQTAPKQAAEPKQAVGPGTPPKPVKKQ